jgi:predicted RecA/RadA family phage recombinase
MAFNVRPGGNAESVPVASGVESGDVVRIGNLVGVAQIDAEMGRDGVRYATIALEGIANAVDGALTVGQAVYTSTAAPTGTDPAVVATLTADDDEGNKVVGIATRAKSAGTGMAWFKLVQSTDVAPAA